MRNRKGTNQYKIKYNVPWTIIMFSMLYFTAVLYLGYQAEHPQKIISPLPDDAWSYNEPTPTPMQENEANVMKYITDKWSKHGTEETFRALHIAKNESGYRKNAVGYNCIYDGKSQACKKEDRNLAWSVDCGVMQINVKGTVCPQELFNPFKNIDKAYSMYEKRGFQPWVSAKLLGYVR